jgi:hypothetical protein
MQAEITRGTYLSITNEPLNVDEPDLGRWVAWNGIDVNMEVFRKVTGNFLGTGIPNLCWGVSRNLADPHFAIFGSAAYKTIAMQLEGCNGWYTELTGLDRMGAPEIKDFDIWVPAQAKSKLSKHGITFKPTGSNPNIEIARVVKDGLEVQIHALADSDSEMNPLEAVALTTTDILATCIVQSGPDLLIVDPYMAIPKGPLAQEFPQQLFDKDNILMRNSPRRALAATVWAMSTPILPAEIENIEVISSQVKEAITNMSQTELQSLAKKFIQYSQKEPFQDRLYEESSMITPLKLARVGVLPALLEKLNLNQSSPEMVTAKHILLQYIGNWLEEYDAVDEATYYKPGDYSKLEKIADNVNWKLL